MTLDNTEQTVNNVMSKIELALMGLQVDQALTILAGVTGEVLANLPKNEITYALDHYIKMVTYVSAMAEEIAEAPTLN